MSVKRWNLCKAKRNHYIALTNKLTKTLLPSDLLDVLLLPAHQDFCNITKKAAKKINSRGYRNNYIPSSDAECESFDRTFLQYPEGDDLSLAATVSLSKLNRKRRNRYFEGVMSIEFDALVEMHKIF